MDIPNYTEEVRRREFCMTQAVMLDDITIKTMVAVAEEIYRYVYGDREDSLPRKASK